jgi:hypothetical protein
MTHFNNKARGRSVAITSSVWSMGGFRLFMSHVTDDKILASEVKQKLLTKGISAFVAHEDIEPTKKWEEEIEKALATCDALVAFITPKFHESNWTDQEVGYCIRRRVLIVPVSIGMTPYGFMGKYQGLQCKNSDANEIAEKLFDILMNQDLTSAKIAEALVCAFENASSFESGRKLSQHLKKIKTWTPDLLRRIEQAVEQNFELSEGFGVPERVKRIVKKNSF